LELSQQLTVYLSRLCSHIRPEELLPKRHKRANLTKVLEHSVRIKKWVCKELELSNTPEMFNHLLTICKECKTLSNWFAVESITEALYQYLTDNKNLPEDFISAEDKQFIEDTKTYLSRDKVGSDQFNLVAPSVPILRYFLKSITQKYSGDISEFYKDGIINMTKVRTVGDILSNFIKTHCKGYEISMNGSIQKYIKKKFMDQSKPLVELEHSNFAVFSVEEVQAAFHQLEDDPEFKVIIEGIVKETIENEFSQLQKTLLNDAILSANTERMKNIKKVLKNKLTAQILGDSNDFRFDNPQVQQILQTQFPGLSIHHWSFFDSSGAVHGSAGNVCMDYFSWDNNNVIVEVVVRKQVDLNEMIKILNTSKFFSKKFPAIKNLSCALICSEITDDARFVTDKHKIKLFCV